LAGVMEACLDDQFDVPSDVDLDGFDYEEDGSDGEDYNSVVRSTSPVLVRALLRDSQGSYLFCHFWYFSLTGLQNYRINSQLCTGCKKISFFFAAARNNYF